MREVVEDPAHRHLDQIDLRTEQVWTVGLDHITGAAPVRGEVVAHQRALVLKALLKQQVDREGAVVPGWRAIAGRSYPGRTVERFETLYQNLALPLGGLQRQGILVEVPVVPNLVTSRRNSSGDLRVRACRVTGDEECSRD